MNGGRPKIIEKKSASTHSCGRVCRGRFIISKSLQVNKANSGQAVSILFVKIVLLGKLLLFFFSEESTLGLTSMED